MLKIEELKDDLQQPLLKSIKRSKARTKKTNKPLGSSHSSPGTSSHHASCGTGECSRWCGRSGAGPRAGPTRRPECPAWSCAPWCSSGVPWEVRPVSLCRRWTPGRGPRRSSPPAWTRTRILSLGKAEKIKTRNRRKKKQWSNWVHSPAGTIHQSQMQLTKLYQNSIYFFRWSIDVRCQYNYRCEVKKEKPS